MAKSPGYIKNTNQPPEPWQGLLPAEQFPLSLLKFILSK